MIGLQLACAPWMIDYQGDGIATANAVATGVALMVTGIAAKVVFRRWIEGIAASVALWLLISPLTLGFANVKLAALNAVIAGAAELLLVVFTLLAKDPRDLPWSKADVE